jgi:predicted nucleic acid-binding protein
MEGGPRGRHRETHEPRAHRTYEAWLADHLSAFEVLAVTVDTAVAYAGLRVALRKAGRPIPANDAWIAALSLQHRLPVLSQDRHFLELPGVQTQGW